MSEVSRLFHSTHVHAVKSLALSLLSSLGIVAYTLPTLSIIVSAIVVIYIAAPILRLVGNMMLTDDTGKEKERNATCVVGLDHTRITANREREEGRKEGSDWKNFHFHNIHRK